MKASAQTNQKIYFANSTNKPQSMAIKNKQEIEANGFLNNINSRAARHLIMTFENATNIQWLIDEKEIVAYFTQDEEKVKICYNKNGYHLSIRKIYPADKLDPLIAQIIKNEVNDDFSIYMVTEVTRGDNKIYEITLQNRLYWCIMQLLQNKEGSLEKLCENMMLTKS
jgi:hypothetical protein